MQGEFNGKPMFRHRYVGMDEESIRGEITRLQGEIYAMEEALEYFNKDNNEIREQIAESQEKNEKLMRSLEIKLQNLEDALDYSTPVKAQLEAATKGFTSKLDEIYNADRLKKQEKSMSAITSLTILNTILLLVLIGLVGYSILFI